jgi:hypothetical protein
MPRRKKTATKPSEPAAPAAPRDEVDLAALEACTGIPLAKIKELVDGEVLQGNRVKTEAAVAEFLEDGTGVFKEAQEAIEAQEAHAAKEAQEAEEARAAKEAQEAQERAKASAKAESADPALAEAMSSVSLEDEYDGLRLLVSGDSVEVVPDDYPDIVHDDQHPLQFDWTWTFFKKVQNKSYEECTHTLGTTDTVEAFWRLYQHVKRPGSDEKPTACDDHVFRDGIKPMWEDEQNVRQPWCRRH